MNWKNATISNNFMFRLVMEKQELCKPLLERILDIRISRIVYLEPEKNLEAKLVSKGIRLDLYVEDEQGIAYDIEMQVDDRYKDYLGERTRYYLSMMDNDSLKKGEPYHKLRKSYIIFICLFDPFGLNLPKYTFTAHCDEQLDLKLNDGVSRIFLNCTGDRHKTTKALANLLNYIADGTVSDTYTAAIEHEVVNFREDDGKERLFMTYQQTLMEERMFAREEGLEEGREEGRKEGRKEGRRETIAQTVLKMFKHNMRIEDIANIIELPQAQIHSILKDASLVH